METLNIDILHILHLQQEGGLKGIKVNWTYAALVHALQTGDVQQQKVPLCQRVHRILHRISEPPGGAAQAWSASSPCMMCFCRAPAR
jgi:hypothetical protein